MNIPGSSPVSDAGLPPPESVAVSKPSQSELLQTVMAVVEQCSNSPSEELIAMGNALIQMGEAVENADSENVMAIVQAIAFSKRVEL